MNVFVPCHPKDAPTLDLCLRSIRQHVRGCNSARFFVCSREKLTDEAEWISEDRYPFTLEDVEARLPGHDGTARWYRQQLLKLYAGRIADGLGARWLQSDSEIVFQRHVEVEEDRADFGPPPGRVFFSPYCVPHLHGPYFAHMARLVPGLTAQTTQSLISHHVVYDRDILESLFATVEAAHGKPFWHAYLDCVDPACVTRSGAAENELYSQYALQRFPKRVHVRQLRFEELKRIEARPDLDFASFQAYNRAP